MAKRRILAGGIAQESHSFNPVPTGRSWFNIRAGAEAVEAARGSNSVLGGIVDAAGENGAEVIVPVIFRAQSGGPVEDAVFAEMRDRMCEAARRGDFDAIVLPLHGGMLTPSLEDPEGALMVALREIVGTEVPLTAGFDLHAHVTPEILARCDLLAGYLTNPHGDQGSTGQRAFRAALDMLDGRLRPALAAVHLPMLTLGNDRTDEEPLLSLHARARAAVGAGAAYDVSIFNAQQFLDVHGLGQWVLAYGNGTAPDDLALKLAGTLWDRRRELIGTYPSLDEYLDRAARGTERPLVLGDQGDRVAGGSPGDGTYVLRALMARADLPPSAVPIADAEAVRVCQAAGPGAMVTLTVGGRYSTVSPPVTVTGEIVSAGSSAEVVYDGPADAGYRARLGGYAVLRVGKVHLVLTDQPHSYLDPSYFRAMGVDPALLGIVITRSGYHYTLNYAAIGECVTVDTPGMTSYRVGELPFARARPFFPLDDVELTPRLHAKGSAIP
ncbi:M81 family peptidase [Roseomonas sp. KE2513]|uniref:M81 family metallopeptidase n=1 Tax=Roseomonas sp. KE2513 TaxID=2479202 RepID=UPI0018E03662|nr:M81 family metallopeptidase [Roseomonas sp. KE2513]MBI0537222.1 M81 family peptidase [Roseomonas sp. KE2513]